MNSTVITPSVPGATARQGAAVPGEFNVQVSTPAGQAAPTRPVQPAPATSPNQKAFLEFRPQLAAPATADLFSDDPAIQALLSNPNVDMETVILAQMALNNKQLETLNASKAKDIQANQKVSEQNQAERKKQIQDSKDKLEAAAKKGWWSKLLDVVGKAAAFIGSLAVLVAAVVAAPVTGGLSLGVAALAIYMMASSAVDLANEINVAINGESARWDFKLSVGALVGWIAGKLGASDEVKKWIEMGVDLVVNVAAMFMIPGAQLTAGARILSATAKIIGAVAQASKAGVDISTAFDVKDLAYINATLDQLQAQIDRLTQNNKQLMEMLKVIQETKADNDNTVTEVLEAKQTTMRRIQMA